MINRIFFISESVPGIPLPGLLSDPLPANALPRDGATATGENIYFALLADPLAAGSLENAYALIDSSARLTPADPGHSQPVPAHLQSVPAHPAVADHDHSLQASAPCPVALALTIREPLTSDSIRFITSFLFIPSYPRISHRPVILLTGDSPQLLAASASALTSYLDTQGIPEPLIHNILTDQLSRSVADLSASYTRLLQTDQYYNNNIFFRPPDEQARQSALSSLQQAERDFQQQSPRLYELIHTHRLLELQHSSLGRQQAITQAELANQRQYLEILRTDHAAREIQDYYTREYEILPLWYKRFGHILKVLTGKRTFASLFRDDVKKHTD